MQECGTISHHHIRPDPTPPAMVSKSSCCSILRPPHNLKDVMMRQNNSNRGRNLCYDSKKLLPSLMPPPMPVNKSDLPAAHCPCQDERRVRVLWLCCCCWWNICISEPVASNYPADRRPHLRAVLLFFTDGPFVYREARFPFAPCFRCASGCRNFQGNMQSYPAHKGG